ncbi:MAG: ATP phosphoribosyltransferase [Lactobacillales bacterium]|jgi:ATP phosphoribosyltransferase|nr:ATP phosphoribosyltransferase [Lactobacillales bacterium]
MAKQLTIALTKGRLERQTAKLFQEAGIDTSFLEKKERKLIFETEDGRFRFLLVKAPDVTTYVRQGVADVGIVGKDTLVEHPNGYYEMLDLGIGKCKFSVASTPDYQPDDYKRKTIATKYPTIAREYFDKKGEVIEVIKIEGSVEIAPVLHLADAIVDIVETGNTLRENGLEVFEDICPVSARLIVNKAAAKRKQVEIFALIEQLLPVIEKKVG